MDGCRRNDPRRTMPFALYKRADRWTREESDSHPHDLSSQHQLRSLLKYDVAAVRTSQASSLRRLSGPLARQGGVQHIAPGLPSVAGGSATLP